MAQHQGHAASLFQPSKQELNIQALLAPPFLHVGQEFRSARQTGELDAIMIIQQFSDLFNSPHAARQPSVRIVGVVAERLGAGIPFGDELGRSGTFPSIIGTNDIRVAPTHQRQSILGHFIARDCRTARISAEA
jgi:hypothetical protein